MILHFRLTEKDTIIMFVTSRHRCARSECGLQCDDAVQQSPLPARAEVVYSAHRPVERWADTASAEGLVVFSTQVALWGPTPGLCVTRSLTSF